MNRCHSIVRSLLACAIATSVSSASLPAHAGDPPRDPIVPREAMVRLAPGYSIDAFNSQFGSSTIRSIESRNIHLLLTPQGQDEEQWLNGVLANPPQGFIWGELNYEGQDGEGRTGSFYVSGIYGSQYQNQYARERIRLPDAHQRSTGAGSIVCVLDTGIDSTHPLLADRIQSGGFNFVDWNADTEDRADGNDDDNDGLTDESFGHGTFMAGLIHMVAPDAMLMPVKVLNSDGHTTGFAAAAGMFHAIDAGVDVINMSFGSTYDAEAVKDALLEAEMAGIVVVAAAGNRNLDDPEEHPATVYGVIGVASTDENDGKSTFSNFHAKLSMSAPGSGGVYSTIPETAQGHRYAEWEGTSLSTSMVSGTAALLISANPQWHPAARAVLVKQKIERSADPINHWRYSQGELGAGRLDAGGAMDQTILPVTLTDASVGFGFRLAGGLEQLSQRDENLGNDPAYLHTRSQFGFSALEPNITDVHFGHYTDARPSTLAIGIESKIDHPSGSATIRLKNWSTGRWKPVHQYTITSTEFNESISGVSTTNRISQNGRIEVSVKHVVTATFSLQGFQSYFDIITVN